MNVQKIHTYTFIYRNKNFRYVKQLVQKCYQYCGFAQMLCVLNCRIIWIINLIQLHNNMLASRLTGMGVRSLNVSGFHTLLRFQLLCTANIYSTLEAILHQNRSMLNKN